MMYMMYRYYLGPRMPTVTAVLDRSVPPELLAQLSGHRVWVICDSATPPVQTFLPNFVPQRAYPSERPPMTYVGIER
jgi:hypothetical protein